MKEIVTLVDENDITITNENRDIAHSGGLLHRSYSIFLFCENSILLHKRPGSKSHSQNLWVNACNGHSIADDVYLEAYQRLQSELNITPEISKIFTKQYKIRIAGNIIENEINHVFVAKVDKTIIVGDDYKWMSMQSLKTDMYKNYTDYSKIFNFLVDDIMKYIQILVV